MSNKSFNKAKKAKNDNWKTYIYDIVKHMKQVSFDFADIICCCNDYDSEFRKYFENIMERAKGTIKTPISYLTVVEYNPKGKARVFEMDNELKKKEKVLEGTGDFNSPEVINLIKEATVVITNPPFSIFREFVELLIKLSKSFVIIGPKNACAYRWYFKLWKEGKIEYGYPATETFWFQNKKGEWKSFGNIAWHVGGHVWVRGDKEYMLRGPKFKERKYPLLENYKDCILVDKISNIPVDYWGLMAVPASFGYKLHTAQFNLIDLIEPVINGKRGYTKIIIKRKKISKEWKKNLIYGDFY